MAGEAHVRHAPKKIIENLLTRAWFIYILLYVYIKIYVYICLYMCVCVFVCVCVCVCLCVCVCVNHYARRSFIFTYLNELHYR